MSGHSTPKSAMAIATAAILVVLSYILGLLSYMPISELTSNFKAVQAVLTEQSLYGQKRSLCLETM